MVAGYHRDLLTGGTYRDPRIFILEADALTSSNDWRLTPNAISDIDVAGYTDPVQIEYGEEDGHILYQSMRNDTTGNDRLGLWYARRQSNHGHTRRRSETIILPQMTVHTIDDEDRLAVAWKEGSGG